MDVAGGDSIVSEYQSSLQELTFNSKPHINMLTMLAEENQQHASKIVPLIESHIQKVPSNQKLPVLYLIDSIVKNCASSSYPELFAKNIVKIFVHVFDKVDEKTRQALFKLRQTWLPVFAGSKLYGIDIKVHAIDPAWPVQDPLTVRTAQKISLSPAAPPPLPSAATASNASRPPNIHVNPKFIEKQTSPASVISGVGSAIPEPVEGQLPMAAPQTFAAPLPPFTQPVKQKNYVNQKNLTEIPTAGSHVQNFLPSVVTVASRDPRLRRSAKRGALLGACPSTVPAALAEDALKEKRPLHDERVPIHEPPPETLSRSNHAPDRHGGDYVAPPASKERELRDENDRYERYPDHRYRRPEHPYSDHFGRRRNLPQDIGTNFREGVFHDPRIRDQDQIRPEDGTWHGKRGHKRRSDFDNTAGSKPTKGDDRAGCRSAHSSLASFGGKDMPRSHGSFIMNKSISEPEISGVDHSSKLHKSKSSGRDEEGHLAGIREDVDFRVLPIKKRRRSSELCDAAEVPPGVESRSPRGDSGGSGYDDSQKRKEKLLDGGFHAKKDQDMRHIYSEKEDAEVQLILPTASVPGVDLRAVAESRTEMVQDSLRSSPSGAQLRISVDAPILPDSSVTSLVEHRANIFQRADQQLADGLLSKQQYNEIMRDMTSVMDSLQRQPLIAVPPTMEGNVAVDCDRRMKADVVPTTSLSAGTAPSALGVAAAISPANLSVSTSAPIIPQVAISSAQMLPLPLSSLGSMVLPGGVSQSVTSAVTHGTIGAVAMTQAGTVGAPSITVADTSSAVQSEVASDKSGGLEPIPANNRIFVDGRAYEVRYIDEVAVIERNGLPHRIYFVGAPRDVVVDGIAHSLPFGETRTIMIDGQPHAIRFGAPSRELYMGSYPFRGSFGGPPIYATINGVKHKIQLCGPPPEVQIDPEPAYELLRYIQTSHLPQRAPVHDYSTTTAYNEPAARRMVQQQPQPAPTPAQIPMMPMAVQAFVLPQLVPVAPQNPPPVIDPTALISRLVKAGIIGPQQSSAASKPPTPPIPTVDRFQDDEVVERRRQPPSELKTFAMKLLKVRYQMVVESLYRQKIQCSTCGMRFAESNSNKYSKHLDWHFKQNRRDKAGAGSTSRPWYLAAEDWVNFEETGSDISTRARSAVFEAPQAQDESSRGAIVSTNSVITATEDDQCCLVCGEKFEQFWDEDEETWKLRNATLIDRKAYHPLCYQDVKIIDDDVIMPSTTPIAAPKSESPSDASTSFALLDHRIKEESSDDDDDEDDDQKPKAAGSFSKLISETVSGGLQKSGSSYDLLKSVLSVVGNARSSSVTTVTTNVGGSCSSSSQTTSGDFGAHATTPTTTANKTARVVADVGNNILSLIPGLAVSDTASAGPGSGSRPAVDVTKVKQEPPDTGYERSAGGSRVAAADLCVHSPDQQGSSSRSSTPLHDESPCRSPGTPVKDEIC